MKTIICLAVISIFSLNVIAKDGNPVSNKHSKKYCSKMKGGELFVLCDGKEMTSDIYLPDGTKVKINGTLIRKNGTVITLKEGECIDEDGKIEESSTKTEKKK